MSDHFIHPYLADGLLIVEWHCEAGENADCRNHCDERGCRERCQSYDEHRPTWVPNFNGGGGPPYCHYRVWMDEGTWDELYQGPETDVRPGPVTFQWEGDYYTWRYDE